MASARPAALVSATALVLLVQTGCPTRSPPELAPAPTVDAGELSTEPPPAVIVMIGDGMGKGQLEAASYYQTASPEGLRVFSLPHRGELATGSPSGITDSAASGTALAAGVATFNGRVGIDRNGNAVQNLVELAHERGMAAGIVTTSAINHATPAAFTAHVASRGDMLAIADQQVLETRAEVMLGGGMQYFLPAGPGSSRDDDGLLAPLQEYGYQIVSTAAELAVADPARGERLAGLFASYHMDYEADRPADSTQPTLAQMTRTALTFLERNPSGFFLMVEGARIDMASHGNDLEHTVTETIAFDRALQGVLEWAETRENVTILVTADHETGGLEVSEPSAAGEYPEVTWRSGGHTSDRVPVFGVGPGSEWIHGVVRDNRWIHAIAAARIERSELTEPARVPIPNGDLHELRHVPTVQVVESGFGAGLDQLDTLHLDADRYGLAIGVGGLFERGKNALVILIDEDFGTGSGLVQLTEGLGDQTGVADSILSSLHVDASAIQGFGADFALVDFGGEEPSIHETSDRAGLRGLHPPFGKSDDLGWLTVPIVFAEGVRSSGEVLAPQAGEGFETLIPWDRLYPDLAGSVPQGASIAVAVLLVNDDGGYLSNQALPPFPIGTENPGRAEVALPGVVVFRVDANRDWLADGDTAPEVVRP